MNTKKNELSSNMEDYLEAITILKKKNGIARVRDISNSLNVRTSSVTSALNNLVEGGFVIHEKYGYVELTKEGKNLAQSIQKRHDILIKFLTQILGIDLKIASEDACKMEHTLNPKTFQKLTKFIEFVKSGGNSEKSDWLKSFDCYLKKRKRRKCKMRQVKQKD